MNGAWIRGDGSGGWVNLVRYSSHYTKSTLSLKSGKEREPDCEGVRPR